jgi:hypothetical protein
MKGSPVRVRASALAAFAGHSSALATVEGGFRVRNGYISDQFMIDEGVLPETSKRPFAGTSKIGRDDCGLTASPDGSAPAAAGFIVVFASEFASVAPHY